MFKNYISKFIRINNIYSLKPSNIFKFNITKKFMFQSLQNEEMMIKNISLLDGTINKLKDQINSGNIKIDDLYNSLQIYEFTKSSYVKKEAENLYIEIINNKNFIDQLNISDLSKLIFFTYLLPNITQKEIDILSTKYLKTKSDNQVQRIQHLEILDTIYYPENKGFDLDEIKNSAIESALYYFDTYANEEIYGLFGVVLFMKDEDIKKFVYKIIEYFDTKLLNINNDIGLSIDGRYNFLQFYMRILKECDDSKIKNDQAEKIRNFYFTYSNKSVNPDLLLCIASNYSHYVEFNPELVEIAIKSIKINVAAVRNEFLLELFFLIMHYDINQFNDQFEVIKFINTIVNSIKDSKTISQDLSVIRKDFIYFKGVRNKMVPIFEKWCFKMENNLKDDKEKYNLFINLVNRSMQSMPFATLEFSEKVFDKLYNNFIKVVKI